MFRTVGVNLITAGLVALVLAMSFAAPVAAGPFEDAVVALKSGDYATAYRLFRSLADHGVAAAQGILGVMHAQGQGVPQSDAEAAKWYRLAADQGEPASQLALGTMYAKGRGVPQSDAEAAKWYRLAADQGEAWAQSNLGVMYAQGQGVPQDYISAHMWFDLSAARGDQAAVKNLGIVARRMTPAQIAEAQKLAREWKPKPN
jgi:TPR repeat protein